MASLVACLTDPPPDLVLPRELPRILHDAVSPQAGTITTLPTNGEFVVPVEIPDPAVGCNFVYTYMGVTGTSSTCRACNDGSATFVINPHNIPSSGCSHIRLALAIDQACSQLTGDEVSWDYTPPACVAYDAGPLQDGAFPSDAAGDTLPVVGVDP